VTAIAPETAPTLGGVLRAARARLREAGVATPDLDARLLVAAATAATPARMIAEPDAPVDAAAAAAAARHVARRAAGEPVARILGAREFWGLSFHLNAATLEPRPDSETIVEAALDHCRGAGRPLRIADLGTGSGCLLVALLAERPAAAGIGVDLAAAALAAARGNAEAAGVAGRALFVQADFGRPVAHGLDLVVSNPPYVTTADLAALDREVRLHDPRLALDGGADGLGPYRRLLGWVGGALAPGGVVVLEIAPTAAAAVGGIAEAAGLSIAELRPDLGGRPRALVLRGGN